MVLGFLNPGFNFTAVYRVPFRDTIRLTTRVKVL